jgi:tetratricopeptide (TPR) repeat protein
MGEVYETEDIELAERVALKTIRPNIVGDERAIDRFKREIHLARQVSHPNVCRIFDLGYHDVPGPPQQRNRVTFLTMELLAGETLAERLERSGRMSAAEALPIIRQMAAALDAAHRAGITHRDFKSSNVMLVSQVASVPRPLSSEATNRPAQTPTGRGGLPGPTEELRAVVTDFGLARSAASLEEITRSLSGGSMVGTPAYMAPEQVEGGQITPATDIYALGVVMYEMLTGVQPFVADTPLAIALKRLKEAAPPPRMHVPDLDPVWEAVILRCLERDPADRFVGVNDVVKALAGEEVPIGKRALEEQERAAQAEKKRQRLRWALTAGVAAILFVSALAYHLHVTRKLRQAAPVAGLPTGPIKVRRSVAVLGFKNLAGRPDVAWLSTALSEMFSTELGAGEELRVISGENVARTKIDLSLPDAESFAQDTLVKIRKNLGSDVVVLGSYIDLGKESGGQIRLDLRVQDTAAGETLAAVSETATQKELFALVSKAGATLRKELGVGTLSASEASSVQASLPVNPKAARLYSEGLTKLRLFDALAARERLEKAIAAEPEFALTHSALAMAWTRLGYDEKAKEEAKKAFDLSAHLSREDQLSVQGRYREVTHDWEKAVDIYRTLFDFFPDNLEYGLRLASTQTAAGKANEALRTLEALRKLPSRAQDDPRIDLVEDFAADSLGDFKRKHAAAMRAADKARAQGSRLLVAKALDDQAWALLRLGELKQAATAARQSKEIYEAAGDEFGASTALGDGGTVLLAQGDVTGAMRVYQESLQIARKIGNKHNEAGLLNNLGLCLFMQGKLGEAKKMHEQSLQASREVDDKGNSARVINNIANVLEVEGDLAGAAKMYHQSVALSHAIGNTHGVAIALDNLGDVLVMQGNLAMAQKTYYEARALYSETGEKHGEALVAFGLGDLFEAEGNLAKARQQHTEALRLRRAMGEQAKVAESLTALAELSIEEGHPADAQDPVRDALGICQRQKLRDLELAAHVMLARALLSLGKRAEAEKEIDVATELVANSQNRDFHLDFSIVAARVRAASGRPADLAEAVKTLNAALAEATKYGFAGYQFEARLCIGELEMKSGHETAGRAHLRALARDATAKGFLLIARKAAAALGQKPQT